jgi:5-methyltetrahydrofolate--homocysteine methyltransferase
LENKISIKDYIKEKILILDGAMGTMLQQYDLTEEDYKGSRFSYLKNDLKGNNEILSITQPEIIKDIHRKFLRAGADIIETNTFSANRISQNEYNCSSLVREINQKSVELAREVISEFSDKPRFIAASIGPTNKTASISPDVLNPSYRDITFKNLVSVYEEQVRALVECKIDIFLVETIFDTLNAKAAIYAIQKVLKENGTEIPIMLSVSLTDKSGRTLSGQTLEAFYYSIEFAKPLTVGLNCSMGVDDLIPYIEDLNKYVNCGISLYANAGLPDAFGKYNDSPHKMADGYEFLAKKKLLNICGGCCGTTPKHIEEISKRLKNYKPKEIKKIQDNQTYSGLEPFVYNGIQNFIMVAERTNVTGSKKFATLIKAHKLEEALEIAREQIFNGANIIDVNMDADLTDTKSVMVEFLNLIASEPDISKVPIMIDSSDFEVLEAGLQCVQGKSIINSINLKEGEEKFKYQAETIRKYGAAMIVMAFDEKGQANSIERRIEIVDRAYDILVNQLHINPVDIIFDLNIFPIATGIEEHDNNAVDFIEAAKIINKKYPKVMISGGISNLSFSFRGMNKVRNAMHSIFLYHANKAGVKMGIVNPAMLEIYDNIQEPLKTLVEDVVLNKSKNASQKLLEYVQSIQMPDEDKKEILEDRKLKPIEERLQNSLIKGSSKYLEEDLEECMLKYSPIEIVERVLLEGMNRVGILFGEGKMFLPQVVKSSRIMKEAVDYLQKFFKKEESKKSYGKIVLATVKGDVHDIGKNILALILKCNNFEVIDLGVMVSATAILEKALECKPDIVALSGLITPSLEEMINVTKTMNLKDKNLPTIMIGGATTSDLHTALKISPNYQGLVVHTDNASEAAVVALKIVQKDKAFIDKWKLKQQKLCSEYEAKQK